MDRLRGNRQHLSIAHHAYPLKRWSEDARPSPGWAFSHLCLKSEKAASPEGTRPIRFVLSRTRSHPSGGHLGLPHHAGHPMRGTDENGDEDHVLAHDAPRDGGALATEVVRVAVTDHLLHHLVARVGELELPTGDVDRTLPETGVVVDVVDVNGGPPQHGKYGHIVSILSNSKRIIVF